MAAGAGLLGSCAPGSDPVTDHVRLGRLGGRLILALLALGPAQTPRGGHLFPHRGTLPSVTVDGAPADTARLLRHIARILLVDLGLPLPARIAARVYDGPERFEQGLIVDAAVPAARAAELGRFAVGVAIPGAVLLRAPARAPAPSMDWPRLIAHELTHLAQIELAGHDRGPAQWLTEGMAEWVAYRVIERLGLDHFADRRAMAQAAAVEYVRRAGGLDLDRLTSRERFVSAHQQAGTLLTYWLVLHLVDALVTKHGFASLVEYFGAFRVSDDAAANFAASFGTSLDAFEQAALGALALDPLRA